MSHSRKPNTSSSCDSELSSLIRQYPRQTDDILEKLFHVDTRRHKDNPTDRQQPDALFKMQDHSQRCGRSNYRDTYQGKYVRPRSSKRRLDPPLDHNPPKMTLSTWQRDVYRPHRVTGKTESFKPTSQLAENLRTTADRANVSLYQSDFLPQKMSQQAAPIVRESQLNDIFNQFSGEDPSLTTSKTHFKQWHSSKNVGYCELPSFTGSLLYPSQNRDLQSIMRESYQSDGDLVHTLPAKGMPSQLKLEGEQDFRTTHRSTYKNDTVGERAMPFSMRGTLPFKSTDNLPTESQFRHDFPGYKNRQQPLPRKPAPPPKSSITLKFSGDKSNFQTEQREIYKGHDVSQLSRTALCNVPQHGVAPYSLTADANEENLSTFRADYKGVPVDSISKVKLIVRPSCNVLNPANLKYAEHVTSHKQFYKDWPVTYERVRPVAGMDQYPSANTWTKSKDKMEVQTVNSSSYLPPLQTSRTQPFHPKYVPMDNLGGQDFTTVYSKTFRGTRKNLSNYQAKILKRELKKYKATDGLSKPLTTQPVLC